MERTEGYTYTRQRIAVLARGSKAPHVSNPKEEETKKLLQQQQEQEHIERQASSPIHRTIKPSVSFSKLMHRQVAQKATPIPDKPILASWRDDERSLKSKKLKHVTAAKLWKEWAEESLGPDPQPTEE
eukprot:gene13612-19487_t